MADDGIESVECAQTRCQLGQRSFRCNAKGGAQQEIFGRIAGYSQFRSDQKTRPLAVCILRSLHNEIEISAEIPYGWVELRKRNANHYSGTSEPADGARSCSASGCAAPGGGFMAPRAPGSFCAWCAPGKPSASVHKKKTVASAAVA